MNYIAVADGGETVFMEDSDGAVINSLVAGYPTKYFPVVVDPDTFLPTLGPEVEIDTAPRVRVARERVVSRSGGVDLGSVDVDV